MSEDIKHKDAGPDEWKKLNQAVPDDTEGHKRESGDDPLSATPRRPLAIPDTDDDTEGHKR